jgi:hypothetical protein
MPRPNKAIRALKEKNYTDTMWELLLYEYRCAKAGATPNRLGPSAVSSIIAAIKDLEAEKIKAKEVSEGKSFEEIESWLKEVKN